jgi:hypothetical protein
MGRANTTRNLPRASPAHGRTPWARAKLWLDDGTEDPFRAADEAFAAALGVPMRHWPGEQQQLLVSALPRLPAVLRQCAREVLGVPERVLCGECETRAVPPSAQVYAVAMRGHFNCSSCPVPFGHTIAPAAVITLQFFNLRDLRYFLFGYGGPYPHLKAIGIPVRL